VTRDVVQTSRSTFVVHVGTGSRNQTQKAIKAAHRRNLAKLERAVKSVEDYEVRLGLETRWSPEDKERQDAAKKL
jgi:hypothetical protein